MFSPGEKWPSLSGENPKLRFLGLDKALGLMKEIHRFTGHGIILAKQYAFVVQ